MTSRVRPKVKFHKLFPGVLLLSLFLLSGDIIKIVFYIMRFILISRSVLYLFTVKLQLRIREKEFSNDSKPAMYINFFFIFYVHIKNIDVFKQKGTCNNVLGKRKNIRFQKKNKFLWTDMCRRVDVLSS